MTTITLPSGDTLSLKGCKHSICLHKHHQVDESLNGNTYYETLFVVEHRYVNRKKEIVYSKSKTTYVQSPFLQ